MSLYQYFECGSRESGSTVQVNFNIPGSPSVPCPPDIFIIFSSLRLTLSENNQRCSKWEINSLLLLRSRFHLSRCVKFKAGRKTEAEKEGAKKVELQSFSLWLFFLDVCEGKGSFCVDRWPVLSVKHHHRPRLPWGIALRSGGMNGDLPSVPSSTCCRRYRGPVFDCVSSADDCPAGAEHQCQICQHWKLLDFFFFFFCSFIIKTDTPSCPPLQPLQVLPTIVPSSCS